MKRKFSPSPQIPINTTILHIIRVAIGTIPLYPTRGVHITPFFLYKYQYIFITTVNLIITTTIFNIRIKSTQKKNGGNIFFLYYLLFIIKLRLTKYIGEMLTRNPVIFNTSYRLIVNRANLYHAGEFPFGIS